MTPPLIVIGLDGASYNILKPLIAQKRLPNLAFFLEQGASTELLSTLPPATLPAWTSFLTGCQPATHGVTDLWMRHAMRHQLTPANGHWRSVETWLRALDKQGLKIAALGVPGTFPPEPLEQGLIISGFDAPGAQRAEQNAVWPPSFYPQLEAWGGWQYATFNEHANVPNKMQHALTTLLKDIDTKQNVIEHVYQMAAWDVFFVHLQASDTIGHHAWHTWDTASPRHRPQDEQLQDALPQVYARLDKIIGSLRARAPKNCRFMVVSDHGMAGADTICVYINRLLAQMGLLAFHHPTRQKLTRYLSQTARYSLGKLPTTWMGYLLQHVPEKKLGHLINMARGLSLNWRHTAAFSFELDYAPAIWLHRRSAFHQGILDDAHADALLPIITQALLKLRHPHTGAALIRQVRPRASLPQGLWLQRFPDLLIEPNWPNGYRPCFLSSEGTQGPIIDTLKPEVWQAPRGSGMPGVHQREGIFILYDPMQSATRMPTLEIAQAGAMVYALMQQSLPNFVDQTLPHFWQSFFHTSIQSPKQPSPVSDKHLQTTMQDPVYNLDQSTSLLMRLRSLGYMD